MLELRLKRVFCTDASTKFEVFINKIPYDMLNYR